jgi:hypothetical protein
MLVLISQSRRVCPSDTFPAPEPLQSLRMRISLFAWSGPAVSRSAGDKDSYKDDTTNRALTVLQVVECQL